MTDGIDITTLFLRDRKFRQLQSNLLPTVYRLEALEGLFSYPSLIFVSVFNAGLARL